MIISCEKCLKKFELDDKLIPNEGRLLQCGSCSFQWHFIKEDKVILTNEVTKTNNNENLDKVSGDKKKDSNENINNQEIKINPNENLNQNIVKKNKINNVGIFSYLIVFIISIIALLILVDTFKNQISLLINVDLNIYLNSLYETLKDIYLFSSDLIK
tara:strand:- start:4 stop:477 length:474 start_codon:yes stop_codon:yes gene_type:complete